MSSEVGGNCCFWREACFLLGMGDVFNLSLLKAQRDPEILSGGKKGTPGLTVREVLAHNVLQRCDFTALLPSSAAPSNHPNDREICMFGLEVS